jgi:hypothetical protein
LLVSENEFSEFALDVAIDREGEAVLLKDILRDPEMAAQRFTILKELSLLSSLVAAALHSATAPIAHVTVNGRQSSDERICW